MKLRSVLVAAALAAGSLAAGTSAPAAATSTAVPLISAHDMLVDQAHGRVFLSGYPKVVGGSGLVTTDLAGKLVGNPQIVAVEHLARTPDGSALAITRGDGRISVVDPLSVTVTKTVTLPGDCRIGDLAPASGKMFFLYYCGDSWKLGAVDLGTAVFTLDLQTFSYYDGDLLSVPGDPSQLVGDIAGQLVVLDTTGGVLPTATVTAQRLVWTYTHIAITPDGTQVLATTQGSGGIQVFSITDLAEVGNHYFPYNLQRVAVRADGMVAGLGTDKLAYYSPGEFEPQKIVSYSSSNNFYEGGLEFGAKQVYVFDSVAQETRLRLETPGPPAGVTIATGATTYAYAQAPQVTVQITSPTTNRVVSIFATPYGGSQKLVKTVTVDPITRKASATLPKVTMNTTYRAVFSGDADYDASSATTSVKVLPRVTMSTPSKSMSSYFHKLPSSPVQNLTVTALPARMFCIHVVFERYTTSAGWKGVATVHCPHVSSTGKWASRLAYHHPGDRIRVRVYTGSSAAVAKTGTGWYYILFT